MRQTASTRTARDDWTEATTIPKVGVFAMQNQLPISVPAKTRAAMPAGVWYAHLFQVFNTMSFSIALQTPMVLFLKKLDASATVLGIAVALNPLLNILQIPAARYLERFGYRSFVLKGWATRSFFIIGMSIVAFLPDTVSPSLRIGLMLFLLFAFNAARGVSACGFLPWLTHLIPEPVRGRFLSRDQLASALAMLGTMILTALYLGSTESHYAFGFVFLASYAAAVASLSFLRRIPDVPVPHEERSGGRVPWLQMLMYPPFLRLMIYNLVVSLALAAVPVFWIPLMRDVHHASNAQILGMQALASAAAVVSLWIFGRVIDNVGSRPVLGLAGLVLLMHFSSWAAVAAGWLPLSLSTILLLQVSSGIGNGLFNLGNTRLVMSTVPQMGRSHFFALFSVITNMVLGSMPVIWGLGVDGLTGWTLSWGGWQWNHFSVLYAALALITLVGQFLGKHLAEPRAMTTDAFLQELVLRTPSRALTRLIGRRWF